MKYITLLLILVVVGCSKDNNGSNGGEFVGPVHDATLKLTVQRVTGVGTYTSVQNADVSLFATKDEALNSTNPVKTQNTGTTGQVTFSALELDKHFIRAEHPAYGFVIDSVNTPAHSTTIEEVWL
jgi:hypothetical protein